MAKKTKNKLIICCSLKGGVGKSVICSMLSSMLVELGLPVVVVDADVQLSVYRHRQRELSAKPDAYIPWQVESLDTTNPEHVRNVMEMLREKVEGCVIIDCPGNINDQALNYIYRAADIALIPFRYDSDTLDATEIFANALKQVSKARLFFIPNNIVIVQERGDEMLKKREDAVKLLKKYGFVTPRIRQCKPVREYSTIGLLNYCQRNAVKYAFEKIINAIK